MCNLLGASVRDKLLDQNGDLSDFECSIVVGAWMAAFIISETADLLTTNISWVYWERVQKILQVVWMKMFRWVCGIPPLNVQHINQWSRWTTTAEDQIKRHSCQLRAAHVHQNLTIRDYKTFPSESQFLQHIQMVRNCNKQNENINPCCLYINSSGWWHNSVDDILKNIWPLSTNWSLYVPLIAEYYCSPYPLIHGHSWRN